MKKPNILKYLFTCLPVLASYYAFGQELIPLAETNQWVYKRIETEVKSGKEISNDTVKFEIGKPVMVQDAQWFFSDYLGLKLLLRNKPEGHYELDSAEVDAFGNFRQFVIYKNPEKGEILKYKLRNGGIVSVSDQLFPIETSMGEFNCYKYSIHYLTKEYHRFDTYVYPGVGIVFSDVEVSGRQVQMQLLNYKTN